jgi:adenosylcobinamide kinase/adenosylcobinamide-phosphate guanylyltransferase
MLPALTLVTGGIASGKSAFAEGLIARAREPYLYVATAEPGDAEMAAKIAAHRARRGEHWRMAETPLEIEPPLAGAAGCGAVLVDCATMWLANQLGAGADADLLPARFLAALEACPVPVVVVTNEVGLGGVPANAVARAFATEQGRLNQALAAQAGLVVLVAAGLPLALKGDLP